MTTVFKATAAPAEMSPLAPPPADGQAVASPGALGQLDSIGCGAGPCAATGIALAGLSALSLRPTGLWPVVQTDPVGQAVQSLLRLCEALLSQLDTLAEGPLKALLALQPIQQLRQAITGLLTVLGSLVGAETRLTPGVLSRLQAWVVQIEGLLAALEPLSHLPRPPGLPVSPALQNLLDEVTRLLAHLKVLAAGATPASLQLALNEASTACRVHLPDRLLARLNALRDLTMLQARCPDPATDGAPEAVMAPLADTLAGDITIPQAIDRANRDIDELQAEIGRAKDLHRELVDIYGYAVTDPALVVIDPPPMLALIGKERARLQWHAERLAELLLEADDIESQMDDVEHRLQQPHGSWKDHELLRHLKERLQAVKEQIRVLSAFVLQTGWLIGQLEKLGSVLAGPAPARQPGLPQGFAVPGACA